MFRFWQIPSRLIFINAFKGTYKWPHLILEEELMPAAVMMSRWPHNNMSSFSTKTFPKAKTLKTSKLHTLVNIHPKPREPHYAVLVFNIRFGSGCQSIPKCNIMIDFKLLTISTIYMINIWRLDYVSISGKLYHTLNVKITLHRGSLLGKRS